MDLFDKRPIGITLHLIDFYTAEPLWATWKNNALKLIELDDKDNVSKTHTLTRNFVENWWGQESFNKMLSYTEENLDYTDSDLANMLAQLFKIGGKATNVTVPSTDDLSLMFNWDYGLMLNVSDVFAWGCSDAERITPENIGILTDSIHEVLNLGGTLSQANVVAAARYREMRPQGAIYNQVMYNKDNLKLSARLFTMLNACGSKRDVGLGNPYEIRELI